MSAFAGVSRQVADKSLHSMRRHLSHLLPAHRDGRRAA